jgi:hypothetical protein
MSDTSVLHDVHVRLNVGGVHLHTSLNTVMEGARLGYGYFQILCQDLAGFSGHHPRACVEPGYAGADNDDGENRVHFIDADPKRFAYWLGYFRTLPYVEAGPLRQHLKARRLLVHRRAVLHGARLQGQGLSMFGFGVSCLRRADLRDCILIQCDFEGASMEDAKLEGADMSDCNVSGANLGRADLRKANLSNAMLQDAILPAWNSGLLKGMRLTGATGWMPANKDHSKAKLQGADLSSCDLSGVIFRTYAVLIFRMRI